jgi:Zn-dependent protease with chaperone function
VGYVRAHDYGLSVQTLGKWASDVFKASAIELGLGMAAAWLFFFLLRRFVRSWWLWLAALTVPFAAFLAWIAPLAIDPLFNDFRRLDDGALSSDIVRLAERAGVAGVEIFEVDKAIDTTAINAYVTGFADSHRVVLWDTLLAKTAPDETLAVVTHELGHYVLGHVALGVGLSGIGALAALFFADRIGRFIVNRRGQRLGIRGLADPAALPLWILILSLVSFVGQPVGLAVSRHMEHEADRFGLDLTGNNDAAGRAFVALQRHNLSYPRPARWVVWLRSSHPPLAERIEFANRYRPRSEPQGR